VKRGTSRAWRIVGVLVIACVLVAAVILLWPAARAPALAEPVANSQLIARGEYVATAADCVACHTAEGGQRYAGGRLFKLPFGTIVAPNITPDRETGIGTWSAGEFVRALRQGVGQHGEELYPAFPYTSYTRMTDDDALAIRAYLRTLTPVRNVTPSNDLAFPFNQRRLMRFWKILFLDQERFKANPARPPEWNRGAYLVTTLGHCGECHTPRNLLYGVSGRALAGETVQGWTAWNITSDREHGLGQWSEQDLSSYLHSGYAPGRAAASGPMKEAIDYSLSRLTAADIGAISTYLRDVPAVARGPSLASERREQSAAVPSTGDKENVLGQRIFEGACASCHGWEGQGVQTRVADLSGRRSVLDPAGRNVVQTILQGGHIDRPEEHAMMPPFAEAYSDAEIAAAANFVLVRFGAGGGSVTADEVRRARED
jgi:mono/diheme cytochrome c family protein